MSRLGLLALHPLFGIPASVGFVVFLVRELGHLAPCGQLQALQKSHYVHRCLLMTVRGFVAMAAPSCLPRCVLQRSWINARSGSGMAMLPRGLGLVLVMPMSSFPGAKIEHAKLWPGRLVIIRRCSIYTLPV